MKSKQLLPKDKYDNSNIENLKKLQDEEIKPLIPELLTWLQDYNWPITKEVLNVLKGRENLVFPYIADILAGDDVMWKCWIMELLIPSFSDEHKAKLKDKIKNLMSLSSSHEDAQYIIKVATDCYKECFFM